MIHVKAILADLEVRDLLDRAKAIAKAHHVTLSEMFGDERFHAGASARHQFWSDLFAEGVWSLSRIAKLVGRDRTTIRKGIDAHHRRITQAA